MPESLMNEGIWSIPDSPGGGYPFGPTQQGGGNQGWGGTADAYDPHGGSSSSSGYAIPSVPTNHDPAASGGAQTNPTASHYYSGYWAGVQEAMYTPQTLPSAPEPYPIPGYGPGDSFPIPNAHPIDRTPDISRAATSVNPHPFGHYYIPNNLWNHYPWPPNENEPPWVYPDDSPQIDGPLTTPVSSSSNAFHGAAQRVNPELDYLEQDPGNFIMDTFERMIFDPIRPMTNADSARIGHIDVTPGNMASDVTPTNVPSGLFPGDARSMFGLSIDFGQPQTHFLDGIIDSTGFFRDQ